MVANSMRKEAEKKLTKLNKKSNNIFTLVKFIKSDGKEIEGGRCMKRKDRRLDFSKKDRKRIWKNHMKEIILFLFFCFICHIYPPFTRKRIVSLYFGRDVRTRLGVAFFEVYGPPVFHIKVGRPVKCLAQGHNKRTCRLVIHNLS